MNAKPMLCKAPVVRAMLAGLQTQDRRPIGNARVWASDLIMDTEFVDGKETSLGFEDAAGRWYKTEERAPYQPGDIIWVRETYGLYNPGNPETGLPNRDETKIIYPATDKIPEIWFDADDMLYDNCPRPLPMRPSIHMPKWACRLWLKATAVRVERIRDISAADAKAEGIDREFDGEQLWFYGDPDHMEGFGDPRMAFRVLWESLYPGSWERNDWVWVTEFERTEQPADWPQN